MKKSILTAFLLAILLTAAGVSAQTPEPTQTPYIIYIVVTATPTPEPTMEPVNNELVYSGDEDPMIVRPTAIPADPITLVNGVGDPGVVPDITITNPTPDVSSYAGTTEELIQLVVETVMARTEPDAGGYEVSIPAGGTGGAAVRMADGSTCTMDFELVSEPTYAAGAVIPRGEVFWKEWLIRNTGTCTWTPEWEFVFDSGWQIGNTRFHMNRTTAPGELLTVRLAMKPDQKQDGNYYSSYVFEAPDGTRHGKITSSYTVKGTAWVAKPTEGPCDNMKPQHGYPAGPEWFPWGFPWWW